MKKIAALFLDETDRADWEATMSEVAELVCLTVDGNLASTLDALLQSGTDSEPGVIVISAKLYPAVYPELVVRLRALCPGAEFLVISRDGCAPPLRPLLADRIRHLTISSTAEQPGDERLPEVLNRLARRRPWDTTSCLKAGTTVHSFELSCSDDKERVIAKLERVLEGQGEEMELLRQKASLLADELLENAMYGAPRADRGTPMFTKGAKREMLPQEIIVFSFGFDGEVLALDLTDNWGSLEPDQVLEYLALNADGFQNADECGGRGLFIIWRFLDQFHVSVQPGRRTAVGGRLHLASTLDPTAPRGFHIIKEEIAA
ncbi:hypothetical protein [Geomonas propionica]|uniref:ATP-binding protein n=1 Tax=Geomonas propionica TaxID=2798582 RepID=A0ABS0YUF5_9BACT|nr:hypothetical protein [Geomonas propionica]MBJ6801082.1 hypothetical protein [Geomonas propionica]